MQIDKTDSGRKGFNMLYGSEGLSRLVTDWGCEAVLMFWMLGQQESAPSSKRVVFDFGLKGRRRFNASFSHFYSDSTVRRAVHCLYVRGITIKIKRGVYEFNPEYVWRGDSQSRVKKIGIADAIDRKMRRMPKNVSVL